ncbi:MAG: LysR substrate-binding domain-containing protein [Methylococcales bacterium]
MKDLFSIALFVKVVQLKSFSEVSRRVGVSVSTVSRKVSQLEESLGARLLERSTRKLRLTQIGQEYFELCQRGINEFEAASLMVNNHQTETEGVLRISVPPSLDKCLVLPLVARFQTQFPKVRIRIWATDRKVNLIEDGVDIALRVGELKDSSLVARKLLKYRHILVASPTYIEKMGMPKYPSELSQHSLLSFTESFGDANWKFMKDGVTEIHKVHERLALNDHVGIQIAAESDLGITEIPSIICGEALHAKRLIEVLPDWQFCAMCHSSHVTLSAVYPCKQNLSRSVRMFKDFCVENINDVVKYIDL